MTKRFFTFVACLVALSAPAAAQTVVALDHGSATVTFPRGHPDRANPPSAASVASSIAAVDKQLADTGRADQQAALNAAIEAQLGAVIWIAQDDASGQEFVAGGYEAPLVDRSVQLTCADWLKRPKAAWVAVRQCRDLAVREGQTIEVRMTFKSGVSQVAREYAIAGHRYSLSHSDWGVKPAKLRGLPYAHADDSEAFFTSFKFLGDARAPPATAGG